MIKINLKTNKKCSYCGEIKPLSEFYKNKRQNDGYHFYCKDCAKDKRKKEYKKNKKEIRKRQKEYTSKIKQEFLEGKRMQAKKKYCPKCKKIKLAKYFAKDYSHPMGLYVYCNECRREYCRKKRKSKEVKR